MQYVCLCIVCSERVNLVSAEHVPQPCWMESEPQILIPEFWWDVSWGVPCLLAITVSVSHHWVTSQSTASPIQKNQHLLEHLLWELSLQIPPSLLSPNCSSQTFRFFSLLNLFLKPFFFFFLWYIISTHLTGERTQDLWKSCFKTTW